MVESYKFPPYAACQLSTNGGQAQVYCLSANFLIAIYFIISFIFFVYTTN